MKTSHFMIAGILTATACLSPSHALAQPRPKTTPESALKTVLGSYQPGDGEYLTGFRAELKVGSKLNKYLKAATHTEYEPAKWYGAVALGVADTRGRPPHRSFTVIDSDTGQRRK